jgi:hypothetical protein
MIPWFYGIQCSSPPVVKAVCEPIFSPRYGIPCLQVQDHVLESLQELARKCTRCPGVVAEKMLKEKIKMSLMTKI